MKRGEERCNVDEKRKAHIQHPGMWNVLLEGLDLDALTHQIGCRMGERLKRVCQAEDVMQDVLLRAWRARTSIEWRGHSAFRNWLLAIAEHRILDLAKHTLARKRGGESTCLRFSELKEEDEIVELVDREWDGDTPLANAQRKDEIDRMRHILAQLSSDYRDVLHMRLFEERSVAEVAQRLELGVSAVKHRTRAGGVEYLRMLRSDFRAAS